MTLIQPFLPRGTINRSEQPVLAMDPYVLRPWVAADSQAVLAAYQDPAISHWHRRDMQQLQEAEELIKHWLGLWDKETGATWAVCNQQGSVVGRTAISRINLFEGDGEVGYWILPEARGNGIAGRAVSAVRDWAFYSAGLKRLQLTHAVQNEASCKVAEKAGFQLEGVKHSALRHGDGWHDMHLHATVNS